MPWRCFSSDYVGGNYLWPDGTYEAGSFSTLSPARRGLMVPLRQLYELREKIFEEHVTYQQGLLYFLTHDPQVPKEAECANLLVPVCLSSWHVAYGSIRMEPVFMILGQSAGAAASIAITDKVPVQKVDYNKLKDRLRVGKQLL